MGKKNPEESRLQQYSMKDKDKQRTLKPVQNIRHSKEIKAGRLTWLRHLQRMIDSCLRELFY